MDIKAAFLNGILEETIYMEQLEGYKLPGQEEKKMTSIKELLDTQFEMKDLGEAAYVLCYTDLDFQACLDDRKSTSGVVFTLGGGAVVWRSAKKTAKSDSTMEVEYIVAAEAAKELVWLRKFFSGLGVVPRMEKPLVLLWDNTGAIANKSFILFLYHFEAFSYFPHLRHKSRYLDLNVDLSFFQICHGIRYVSLAPDSVFQGPTVGAKL
ncbi:uncharacterized protein LOC133039222 [Cannabis sativa]|uniref:uncharacterized protein LOC133039222 n=1 Tax=Cannabis sativa TaxID=3483 RepID=UPI0029CAAB5D|nr:uncharacterized protein LOC133039222 [Cannabis sativa]